ncbi:unnamed protein product [Camellia sinensis]
MAVPFLLPPVIENLNSLLQNKVALLWGVDKEMKKLSSTLSTIHAVLEDAEQKQLQDKAIQTWLKELNDAAYEADDVLDECATKALRCESEGQGSPSASLKRKFDAIAANRSEFHLNKKQDEYYVSRETSSFITQPQLYGRDEDKEKIVNFLVKDVCNSEDVSVYPILDFDVKRVIKATIESANGKRCKAVDLDSLQRRLHDMLKGKIYLIVLDDVWDEDPDKWDALKYSLACGSKGSSVIITTHLEKVASIMGTIPPHCLSFLSNEDCWLSFKQRAFGRGNEELPNLVAIGKEIVKKCGGVPLAAKSLGGLMRFKSEENEWLYVLESEIWNLHQDKNSILPVLRLSYFICSLLNLQTLILDNCQKLERLPQNMIYLRSLRHVFLKWCRLIEMPQKIGQLTYLKTLTVFVVGKSTSCNLLAESLNLGGELCIEHLERVRNPMDAKEANLVGKQNLSRMELNWQYSLAESESENDESESQEIDESESQENVEFESSENVESKSQENDESESEENIKSELVLEALQPHPNLKALVIRGYKLYKCNNCLQLPPFGQLHLLQIFDIHGMDEVLEYIENEYPGGGGFPSLVELDVYYSKMVCFPKEFLRNLTLLDSLVIKYREELKVLPEDLASLGTLKSLQILQCPKLESLPEEGLRGLESLQSLHINYCPKITSLPASIQSLPKLPTHRVRMVAATRIEVVVASEALLAGRFWAVHGFEVNL